MTEDSVACVIKTPVPLQIGDIKSNSGKPGVFAIDISFPRERGINLRAITFKNYYTAFLTIRIHRPVLSESDKKTAKWNTCTRNLPLMPNPHAEKGSQDYFSVHKHQMLCEPNGVTAMRLILRQPSPVWLSFSVEDIKLYECDQDNLQRGNGSWLSHLTPLERPLNLNVGLPDPEAVASSVQHMWLLTEMVRNTPTCTRVGRFDVSIVLQQW
uniref:Nicolin 1, tubulin polyglutamylase complex subunit n=1 Tax=Callorhinchus milii TaxID=7868 RepID=A0A4W3K9P7_CALMI